MVYRRRNGATQVCLIATNGGRTWQLPKGLIERGEPVVDAARREVEEETGLRGELVAPLEQIEYQYTSPWDGEPVHVQKYVTFFLFRYTGGSTRNHDGEVDDARWFPLEEAGRKLAFKGERGVMRSAARILRSGTKDASELPDSPGA